jgi:hypothetical protein
MDLKKKIGAYTILLGLGGAPIGVIITNINTKLNAVELRSNINTEKAKHSVSNLKELKTDIREIKKDIKLILRSLK